jgi:hypothetical protein
MNKTKKTLAILLTTGIISSMLTLAGSASAEVSHGSHALTSTEKLVALGIVQADENGYAKEETTWSKNDFASWLSKFTKNENKAAKLQAKKWFRDNKDSDTNGAANWAYANGLIEASNPKKAQFGFGTALTYRDLEKALLKLLGYSTVGLSQEDIDAQANDLGFIESDIDSSDKVVRGVANTIILKALAAQVNGKTQTLAAKLGYSTFAGDVISAGDTLNGYGVVDPNVNDEVSETKYWSKADYAVFLARFLGQEDEVDGADLPATSPYSDVAIDSYYAPYVLWATQNKYISPKSKTAFGADDRITYRNIASFVLRQEGYTVTTKNLNDLAVLDGIVKEGFNLNTPAVKGVFYDIILESLNSTVLDSQQLLGNKLKIAPFYVEPTSVTLSAVQTSYAVGATFRVTATVAPNEATNKNITWSSSNPTVATVDSSGNVTTKAVGSAIITVSTEIGDQTATVTINVQ